MKPLLIVDVQPAYRYFCDPLLPQLRAALYRKRPTDVLIAWVGQGLTADTEEDVYEYLSQGGLSPALLNRATFVEKDYGFLRAWMDHGVKDEVIVQALKRMRRHGVSDSHDLVSKWDEPQEPFDKEVLAAARFHHDRIMDCGDFEPWPLLRHSNYVTMGGGRDECLKELELWLQSHDIQCNRQEHLTY